MLKRYHFGASTLAIHRGKTRYSSFQNINANLEEGFRIMKEETSDKSNETRYSLVFGISELAFIRGYFKTPTKFHIGRIENSSGDKNGFKYIPQIYEAMENDLRERGVKYITAFSLAELAHIAVRRYGFYDRDGRNYEELKDSWLKKIPWKAVSLEKRL